MAKKPKATTSEKNTEQNGEQREPEVKPETGLAVRPQEQLAEWTPRFAMSVAEAVELERQKQEFMQKVLKDEVHYGIIPGAGKRKVLFKPGAEALNAAMGLHPELSDAEPPVRDYTGADHGGEPFWSFRSVCRIYRQTGPGPEDRMLVAQAGGSCNSFEVKYRYRDNVRICPECNAAAIFQSKPPKDDPEKKQLGFYCWAKKGGCGARFLWNDQRIAIQVIGRTKNPDVFDLENTGLKMSHKRALVAATLIATGFSTDFTQDLEDRAPDPDGGGYGNEYASGEYPEPREPAPPPPPKAAPKPAPAPKEELTPEQAKAKVVRQVAFALSGTIEPVWTKAHFAQASQILGTDSRLLIGTLVELHMHAHGANCEHVAAIPTEVDLVYPHEESHRAYIKSMTDRMKAKDEPKVEAAVGADVDPDDIPF